MKKKNFLIIFCFVILIFFFVYPFILIDTGKSLIKFGYTGDVSEFENYPCYGENYFYYEDKDISIHNFDFKKFLFFNMIVMEYQDGNVCETEYLLEESYINNFLENADIQLNENNIDLGKLIKGKTAIVGNKRYFGDDYNNSIDYVLDGKYETLYVFYVDDLLVIQVGFSDEGPKFIAYK